MQDPRTESVLTSLGIKFEYIPEFPTAKLVSDPTTQVRREENRAPKPEVERYHKLLAAGAEFPPIVVTKTGKVIDGNTRWGAYDKTRRTVIPAYRCEVTAANVAKLIGVELNAVHGKRMEKAELIDWMANGNGSVPMEVAQRLTGWSPKTVRRVKEALKFNERAKKLNVKPVTVLPEAAREALMKVTDAEAFRAMTSLVDDAGLTSGEINEMAKEVNDLSSVNTADALARIEAARQDRSQQIEERRAGLRASTPMYRQIALHLGWAIKQSPTGLHDTNPYTAAKSQRYLEDALVVIKEALTRYAA